MGALAVALGIGWALAGPACTASAAPAEDDGAGSATTSAASSSESGSARANAGTGKRGGVGAGSSGAAPSGTESTGRSGSTRAAALGGDSAKQDNGAPAAAASAVRPAATAVSAAAAESVASAAVGVEVPDEVLSVTAVVPVAVAPTAEAPVAVFVATRAGRAAARAEVIASSAHTVTGVGGLPGSGSGGNPGQAALAFAVLAAARREFEQVGSGRVAASAVGNSLVVSPNLLLNPGAEFGDDSPSGNSAVSIPGWELTGTPTVIEYGASRNSWPTGVSFAMPTLPTFMGYPQASSGPPNGGAQFFGGGNVATATLTQTVDLNAIGADIDLGGVNYNLSGWLGGYLFNPSAASVQVSFLDANRTYLGASSIGPVTMWDRWLQTGFKERHSAGLLPEGTRYAQVVVNLEACNPIKFGFNAAYNPAFADNISFAVSADLPAPPDPTPAPSVVGALDHVYMVYMENKGYNQIVGSPNAPFTNSLINAYGFSSNSYGLTHPSLPNYYPIVGGTDYGLTYNCASPCISSDNILTANIDAAGKTWRGYAQSLTYNGNPLVSSGDYATDQLPFPAFEAIASDPAYAKTHIVPLEQMAIDLQSADTAPNFAWFAANEDFNGEGPIDFPIGMLNFVLGQLSPAHQYNVQALDQFLSETVPVIMNSPVWNDPTLKTALVVTFDEDNNNLSLGIGNEGNHIVTVVIPSPGAIAGGMRPGSYTATNHYNHYSLLRMIEDSLGLPYLTKNDQYASPMNEFWTAGVV